MKESKDPFKTVTDFNRGDISFENNSKGKIIGIDTISFNESCNITNVYLVKIIKYNLLSISQLCDAGLKVRFKKNECIIKRHG